MKKSKDSLYKGFKTYNMIMSCVWQLLTTLLFGVLAGYLLEKYGEGDVNYMGIAIVISVVVGILVFFTSIIKESKRLTKEETAKQAYEESLVTKQQDDVEKS